MAKEDSTIDDNAGILLNVLELVLGVLLFTPFEVVVLEVFLGELVLPDPAELTPPVGAVEVVDPDGDCNCVTEVPYNESVFGASCCVEDEELDSSGIGPALIPPLAVSSLFGNGRPCGVILSFHTGGASNLSIFTASPCGTPAIAPITIGY